MPRQHDKKQKTLPVKALCFVGCWTLENIPQFPIGGKVKILPKSTKELMECVTTSNLAYGDHRGHQDALLSMQCDMSLFALHSRIQGSYKWNSKACHVTGRTSGPNIHAAAHLSKHVTSHFKDIGSSPLCGDTIITYMNT